MQQNTNKTNSQSLGKLINEHPELPVIPLICNSYVDYYDPCTDFITGYIGTSFISKYCYYDFDNQEEFVIYEEVDSIKNHLLKHHVQDTEAVINNLKWTSAIFFYLVNPQ